MYGNKSKSKTFTPLYLKLFLGGGTTSHFYFPLCVYQYFLLVFNE